MPTLIPVDYDPFSDNDVAPKLVPVDHNPFADGPGTAATLVPVDHNPFAGTAAASPNLIPVDHDPFGQGAGTRPKPTPVDYDPFTDINAGPKFIPVDHDPFADGAGTAPRLVPVEYDPFAGTAATATSFIPVDHDPFSEGAGIRRKLIPVDYDPFDDIKAAPKLIPVNHDPFNGVAGTPLSLVPVDYDPFAPRDSNIGAMSPNSQGSATEVGTSNALRAPAEAADLPRLPSSSGLGITAAWTPAGQSTLGSFNLPVSFWRDPAVPTPAIANSDDSKPQVFLAGADDSDKKKRIERQLDLFNERAFGVTPRFRATPPIYPGTSLQLPPPLLIPPVGGRGFGSALAAWLRSAVGAGKLTAKEAAFVQNNVSSPGAAETLAPIFRAELPKYDGTTYGILVTNEGDVVRLMSGDPDPRYSNYRSAGHVEAKAALWIREHGSSGGVVFHNNVGGTCGYCDYHIETLLPERTKLIVMPPAGATPKNSRARAEPAEYEGNSKLPKPPSTLPGGVENEN